jgi:hypothetical protein
MTTKAEQSVQYQRLILHIVDVDNRVAHLEQGAKFLKSMVVVAAGIGMFIGWTCASGHS